MSIIAMKFGGTSVADPDKIRAAAKRALAYQKKGKSVVMVVSAMGKSTDLLEGLANDVMRGKSAPKREIDQLLATGEQVTISLMAMALEEMGTKAISFTAAQVGVMTNAAHTKARISHIDTRKLHKFLDSGHIVIVAGFQGISPAGDVTTLGRGGSNVSLVAIAAALEAEVCENYSDVDGVFTADPRIVPDAKKINSISYDEMMELATQGVGVLHNRAVEIASKYNVPIHLRNSQNNRKGTMIVTQDESMERIVVRGCALKEHIARITLRDVPNKPGVAANIFHTIASGNVVVDDIIQTISDDGQYAYIAFTIEYGDLADAKAIISKLCNKLDCYETYQMDLAKVSVVGIGMQMHTGVADQMFKALAKAQVNIQNITTSEIKISCLIDEAHGPRALRVVHDAFGLGGKGTLLPKKKTKKATKKTTKKKTTKKVTKKAAKKPVKKSAKKATKKKTTKKK